MENVLNIPANEFDHHRGLIESALTIVQYGDYECPYSASLAGDIDKLFDEYKNVLCHIYRHFPQSGIHEYAEVAALAAEAAAEQDKFWEMHHILFEHSSNLSPKFIRKLAREIELDMDEFEMDMKRFELYDKVKEDYKGGAEAGVTSTPTLFINNVLYEGSSSYWPLKEAIEASLNNYRSAWF